MKRVLCFALFLALLLPAAAIAGPVAIQVEQIELADYGGSALHSTDGCPVDGYWLCGTKVEPIAGRLEAELVDEQIFSGIHGRLYFTDFESQSHYIDVVDGSLDFTVGPDEVIGSLIVDKIGEFEFVSRQFTGPANSWDGERLALWGQNHKPTDEVIRGGRALDIAATVSPIPEPSAALAFGLGTLLVMGRRRFRR